MITKERLEELIEQEAIIYVVDNEYRMEPIKLVIRVMGVSVDKYNKIHNCEPMLYSQFGGVFRDICPISWLYENQEDADFIAKYHTQRVEKFEPPCELKDNEKYKFTTAKGGKMSISKFIRQSGDVEWWLSYVGTHRTFYSYTEAVEYARKLFLGESND